MMCYLYSELQMQLADEQICNFNDLCYFHLECAEHLHDKCIPGFERKSVTPSFETCGILELVNCLEKEMNATEHCKKNETLQNKMTGYIKSIKFDFVKSKRCPCAKDIDVIIETLVDPGKKIVTFKTIGSALHLVFISPTKCGMKLDN